MAIATLAGDATMFVCGGISHMVLLKGVEFTGMSNEEPIVATLRASLPADGLYCFPSIDLRGSPAQEELAAWEARFRAGLTGMGQFLSDVLAAGIGQLLVFVPSEIADSGGGGF